MKNEVPEKFIYWLVAIETIEDGIIIHDYNGFEDKPTKKDIRELKTEYEEKLKIEFEIVELEDAVVRALLSDDDDEEEEDEFE